MKTKTKSAKVKAAIRVRTLSVEKSRMHTVQKSYDEDFDTHTTDIRITPEVEVGTLDGCICLWVAGRQIRIGPLSPEQAEKLSDDLGYDAVV